MTITVRFVDFWDGFNADVFSLTKILHDIASITLIDEGEPDILIYSCFGEIHHKFTHCIKIYISGENDIPDLNFCDYAISYRYLQLEDRHLRFPIFIADKIQHLHHNKDTVLPVNHLLERDFCSIVVSNGHYAHPIRDQFWQKLNKYKLVASGGSYKNNVGGPVPDKQAFILNFKFNIAFENSLAEGYTTEKIFDACIAKTVPIYWGNKLICKDLNPEAFINILDFDTLDSAIDYIIKVDNDPALYAHYLNSDLLKNYPYEQRYEELKTFLHKILIHREKHITLYGRTTIMKEQQLNLSQQLEAYQQLLRSIKTGEQKTPLHVKAKSFTQKFAQKIKRIFF